MDELWLESRPGPDPPGRDGGVALLQQQRLGGLDQPGPALGVRRADAPGLGLGRGWHPDKLPHLEGDAKHLQNMLSICSA